MGIVECDDDERSLRRIVIRILNEDEDKSRKILDKIIYDIEDCVSSIKVPNDNIIIITYYIIIFILYTSFLLISKYRNISDIMTISAFVLSILPMIALWGWSYFQYGSGKLRTPHPATYGEEVSTEARAALESFFAYLQRDSTKVYYRRRNGEKQRLAPNFSYGPLRILLLSASPTVRGLYLLPGASRVKSPIKIDDNLDAILKAINVKLPRRGSKPKGTWAKYPYEDAAIGLIGDPRLTQLDLNDSDAAIQSIAHRLVDWFKENPDETEDRPRSDYPRIQECAKKIYTQLKKISPQPLE